MKKMVSLLVLVAATGVMYTQDVVEISYNWDKENNICATADPLNLATIMEGEWSGPGVSNNIFYPSIIPAGSTTKLMCNEKEFLIVVHPSPMVSFGWMPKEMKVSEQSIQLTAYPKGGKWSLNGQPFDGNFSPTTVGMYEVMYIVTDEYGCTSGVVQTILVK